MLRLRLSSVLKKRALRARCTGSLGFLLGSARLGVAGAGAAGVLGLVWGVPGGNCSKVSGRLSMQATSGGVPDGRGGGTADLAGVGTGNDSWAGLGSGTGDSGKGASGPGVFCVGFLAVAFLGFPFDFAAAFLTTLDFFLFVICFLDVLQFPLCCFFPFFSCFPGLFKDVFPGGCSGAACPKIGVETALVKGGGAEVKVLDFRIKCSGVLSCWVESSSRRLALFSLAIR